MTRYAVARLDDALAATREFLLPVDLGRWLRLAVLSLLVAGGSGFGGGGGASGGASSGSGQGVDGGTQTASWLTEGQVVALVLAVVTVLLAVALVVGLLAAVAEFALVESLRSERVALRASLRRFWWRGVRLFAFRVGLLFALLATVGVLAAVVAVPAVLGAPLVTVAVALVAVPAALAAVILAVAADRFTALFVVPTMLATDERRVLAGWRRFWAVLEPQWRQYAVYAGVAVVLALVTGLLVGVAVTALAVAFLVPFGALALAGAALTTLAWPVGVAVVAVAALGFLAALLAAIGFVEVPVVTFLRFHALLVLGDTDADLDLLGDRRPPLA
jgi:hypothetical protein